MQHDVTMTVVRMDVEATVAVAMVARLRADPGILRNSKWGVFIIRAGWTID